MMPRLERRSGRRGQSVDAIIGFAVMAGVPGYFALQWYTARNWDGGWRVAALVPLLVMAPLVVHAAIAFMARSNLWPLLVILASPVACVYLLALAGARSVAR
jgi:hypothetical protein